MLQFSLVMVNNKHPVIVAMVRGGDHAVPRGDQSRQKVEETPQ